MKNQSENQRAAFRKHAILHSLISDKFILKQLDKLIKLYEQQIEQIGKKIQDLLGKNVILKTKIEQLCKIKGLGLLSVCTIVAETNGFEAAGDPGFDNARQVVSFAGYDIVEKQSGQRAGTTKISKKENSRIRRILFMPAFNAVRFSEPSCKALFERVFERKQIKMKGYLAVQKKLITLCFAIWKNNTEYDALHYSNNVKELKRVDKKIAPTSGTSQNVAA